MDLFTFLQAVNAEITPTKCKIHLAVWNGEQNPLDVYLAGDFEEWQSYQSKRNFNREYIVSLIQLPEHDTWLLAGIYESISDTWNEDHYDYTTKLVPEFESYYGRLKVSFTRSGRQSYLIAENWSESIVVKEITAQRLVVESSKDISRQASPRPTLISSLNTKLVTGAPPYQVYQVFT